MRSTAARCAAATRVIPSTYELGAASRVAPSTYELGAASRVASGSAAIETVDERDVASPVLPGIRYGIAAASAAMSSDDDALATDDSGDRSTLPRAGGAVAASISPSSKSIRG